MAKDVVIRISATDAASPTFRRIASEAKAMGASVDSASAQADRGLSRVSRAGAAFGAATGAAIGLMSEFARAAAEEEAVFARLEQAVENTGDAYDEHSQQIDKLIARGKELAFSDDQVANAMGRLVTVTGDVNASANQMQLVMDLARARNMDLATAADLVGKVMQGNTAILARYGIVVKEGATATEALAELQRRTSGQAQAYADTTQGELDRIRNSFDDLTETLGAHAGSMQTILALVPGLVQGYTALGGIIGALGGGATVGAAALFAGSGLFAYDLLVNGSKPGGSTSENFLASFMGGAAGFLGFESVQKQFQSILDSNDFEAATKGLFLLPGENVEALYGRLALLFGMPLGSMTDAEMQNMIVNRAALSGLPVGQYLAATAANQQWITDPATGRMMTPDVYHSVMYNRTLEATGAISSDYYVGSPGTSGLARTAMTTGPEGRYPFLSSYRAGGGTGGALPEGASEYMRGGMGAVAMTGIGATDAATQEWFDTTKLENYRRMLRETYGEYAGLVEGINSANDATRAFHATQNSLLEQSSVFQAQQSEYSGVLSDMEAAYEVLQKRQAEGIALSREEQEFMKNYATNTERMTGAVEDAIVEQGLLAGQYAENVTKGDQLNEMLAGNTTATGDLVEIIRDLILTMEGVPEEVRSRIEIDRAEEARATLASIAAYLNGLDGRQVNFTVNASGNGLSVGNPSGPGIIPLEADGGTIFSGMRHYADGGTHAIVGERGPELVWLPNGSQVMNTEGSQSRMRGQRTNGGNVYVTVYANSWGEFQDSMRSRGLAEALY